MSQNDDYNYYHFDNFSDSDYARRHPQRRQSSYSRGSVYNVNRSRRKRRNRKRLRNRIIIVSAFIIILVLIIVLFSSVIKGCSGDSQEASASVPSTIPSTVAAQQSSTAANAANENLKAELSPSNFVTPNIKDDNTYGVNMYGVYVWNKEGFELFGGSDARAQTYAETINGFADKLGSGVTVYDMVVPNHTEMGLPQRLKDSDAPSDSQAENIKAMYAALSDKVTPINCYNYLAEHNDEYIYFKSDHHWTGLGAYYAYTAFAESTNQDVLSLEDCTENQIEGFTGSFADYSDDIDSDTLHYWTFPYDVEMDNYDTETEYSVYDGPYYEYATAGSNTYGLFIIGDNQTTGLTVLKSQSEKAEEGNKIAVVKESYGNAFVPYLTNTYEEVHVVDFRYFNQNLVNYCKENQIDEVLFINGVMSANTQIQLDSMSSLFD